MFLIKRSIDQNEIVEVFNKTLSDDFFGEVQNLVQAYYFDESKHQLIKESVDANTYAYGFNMEGFFMKQQSRDSQFELITKGQIAIRQENNGVFSGYSLQDQ